MILSRVSALLAMLREMRIFVCLTHQCLSMYRRFLAIAFAASTYFFASAASLSFSGLSAPAVECMVESSTGLEAVYVLPATEGVTITLDGASSAARWSCFSNLGGAYAEEIGTGVSLQSRPGDMGYLIEDRGRQICFWVVDYSAHELSMESLVPSEELDCSRTLLNFTGAASDIVYYSITGRRFVLSRELELTWQTLRFDEENFSYTNAAGHQTVDGITETVSAPAPLCNTTFVLTGDRFLKAWGLEQSIESPLVNAYAVEANTRATQTPHDADNELKDENEGLGGSAPVEILFEAAVSDAAIFREWQISRDPEFNILENSFNDLEFTYTFTEQGTTYVRFNANNNDGSCPWEGPVYEVFIGESKLDIPNAFSPEGSPGVNDEWKVSYKSLVRFECHIFNKWGKELFHTTDPSKGWDGKVGNKYVPSGVYYYVIKAEGADGVRYNKAGDINIIKYTPGSSQGSSSGSDGGVE